MNKKLIVALGGALVLGLATVSAADIIGKVTLKGTPPAEKPLPFDPQCGKLLKPGEKPTTLFYVAGKGGELADVFVSLKGITGKSTGDSAAPAVLDQMACQYTPYVMAVQTKQTITVKNSDPVLHNVHPTPKPGTANKESNKAQLPKGPDLTFVFPAAEEFLRFKCDIHPWMFAYVNVVDHPHYSVTGTDGTFRIKNVPAGKYTVEAKHRKAGEAAKEIEVKDADVTVEFVLEVK